MIFFSSIYQDGTTETAKYTKNKPKQKKIEEKEKRKREDNIIKYLEYLFRLRKEIDNSATKDTD